MPTKPYMTFLMYLVNAKAPRRVHRTRVWGKSQQNHTSYSNYGKDDYTVKIKEKRHLIINIPQLWEGLSGRLSCGFDTNSIINIPQLWEGLSGRLSCGFDTNSIINYLNYGKDFRVVLAAVSTQIALKLPQLWEGLSGRLSCGFDINSIMKARDSVEEATRLLQKYLAPSSV